MVNLTVQETLDYMVLYDTKLDGLIFDSESKEKFINGVIRYAEEKRVYFNELFECESKDVGQLKAIFFTKREDFVDYIERNFNRKPAEFAMGCFFGGEAQVLVNMNNPDSQKYTLAHETLHLYFNRNIYKRGCADGVNRVRWLDEAFAVYLDGKPDDITPKMLEGMINRLSKVPAEFDMAILDDVNKIETDAYDGYDMFEIIGKYIFENHLEKDYLDMIKESRDLIVEKGKTILHTAIDYCKSTLNIDNHVCDKLK